MVLLVRGCLVWATVAGLPGVQLGWFGLRCSRLCAMMGHLYLAESLAINPVSGIRYFEFGFAQDMFSNLSLGRCLDVSSPRLFGAYVLNKDTDVKVDIVNPDVRDLELSRSLLESMGVPERRYTLNHVYADSLEWSSQTFDNVWCISVVEHIPEPDDAVVLRELQRVLKRKGYLVVTVPVSQHGGDEYRNASEYGLSRLKAAPNGKVFFQRRYNESMIRDRIINILDELDLVKTKIYGERTKGWFQEYIRLLSGPDGRVALRKGPFLMSNKFREFSYVSDLIDIGVACFCFRKK